MSEFKVGDSLVWDDFTESLRGVNTVRRDQDAASVKVGLQQQLEEDVMFSLEAQGYNITSTQLKCNRLSQQPTGNLTIEEAINQSNRRHKK
jgi:hypothetical protein